MCHNRRNRRSVMLRATLPCLLATLVAASAQSPDTANPLTVPRFDVVYAASASLVVFAGPDATETYASAIDNEGSILGMYADMTNAQHVYLRSLRGSFETFSAPGSPD